MARNCTNLNKNLFNFCSKSILKKLKPLTVNL